MTIEDIFKPEELSAAREEALGETLKELALFSKRAPNPAKRIALAELEKCLSNRRESWVASGQITPTGRAA